MKRLNIFLILVFMACSCWINSAFAQDVTFSNAELEKAVKKALRIADADSISETKLETLERLTATNKGIDNLTGLEHATELKDLDLGNNVIVNLGPLSNLTSLEELDLADNQIEDLFPLRTLTSLTDLDLDGNQIVNLPTNLSGLSSLETLDLTYNSVEDVTSLSELTTLKRLYLRYNDNLIDDLTDFRQLANARALVKLKFGDTRTTIDLTLPRAVTFRDDNLVTELRTRLGLETDDPIFPVDMETQTFTTFSAPNRSIDNLTGLETATNLTTLNLSGNTISSLTPLAKLVNLETLNLADNEKISSISSLAKLTVLTTLNLSNNKISSVSSLSKLVALETLNLSMNQISSLTSLSGLTSLRSLDLSDNRIRDVLPLQELSTLRTLDLSGNDDITNIEVLYRLRPGTTITPPTGMTVPDPADVVSFPNAALETAVRSALRISKGYPILPTDEKGLDTLTRLTATRKNIDDLTGLEEATGLTSLDLGQNDIENLTPLQNLTSLTTLDLADNQIENFSPLSGLTNLTTLDLGQNAIVSVPALSSLTSLVTLDLADNNIQNVSTLSGLSALKTLDLRDNSRSDQKDNDVTNVTPLSGLEMLKTLYLRGNDNLISDLTQTGQLANARALVKLKFGDTRTTIDLTLPRAVTFRDDNLVTLLRNRLNLQIDDPIFPVDMETLRTLSAPNPLSDETIANITGLETATGLTTLNLAGHDISSLTPLAKLTNLTDLNLSENNISSVSSLAKLTSLTTLNLSDNRISSVTTLAKLTALTDLNLSDNSISSLTSLSGLTALTNLDLSDNTKIKDVLPLTDLSNLTSLDLTGNTGLTQEKASVLYILTPPQGQTTVTGVIVPTNAELVVFANTNLEAAVRSKLGLSTGYPVSKSGIAKMTSLTATRKEIDDLTGLEEATGLTSLDLGDNEIVNLGPLQNLSSLETLDLADNAIEDFGSLTGLGSLETLDLGQQEGVNPLVDLPRSLTGLSSLETLDLADNQIENVSPLTGLTSLTSLDLKNNNLGDVEPLSTMTSLKRLYLRGNPALSNVKYLVDLKAASKTSIDITLPRPVRITDDNLATAVRNALNNRHSFNLQAGDSVFPEDMELLTTFDASNPVQGEEIENLTGLEAATNLTSLNLSGNDFSSLTPLAKLVLLETLDLSENDISSISSLAKLTVLTDLNLSMNRISSLTTLAKLTSLTDLNLSDNSISSLTSLSGLTALTTLNLSNNVRIRDVLPLAGLISLTDLNLEGNTAITNAKVLYPLLQGGTTILPVSLMVPTTADIVTFENADLEAAVRTALRLPTGYPVFKTGTNGIDGIDDLMRLTATRKGIDDLTGLEEATALTHLDLGDNAIVDASPLVGLTSLVSLDLANNQIVTVGPPTGFSNLETLDLGQNLIVNLPSDLTGASNLETFDLADNQITDVSPLTGLTSLTSLDLKNNNLGDVQPLSTMASLKKLYLRGNPDLSNVKLLVDLKAVSKTSIDITLPRPVRITDDNLATAVRNALNSRHGFNLQAGDSVFPEDMALLTTFDASNPVAGEEITTLTGLETAINLTSLDLSGNSISSVTPLAKLVLLETLDLSENSISSISSLAKLMALTNLNLSMNNISSLTSLAKLTALTDLNLSDNNISSLTSLSDLSNLEVLNLSNNVRIKDVLPLAVLNNLQTLNLSGNTAITNSVVLYRLRQLSPPTTITLPPGPDFEIPTTADLVTFTNAALETAVRSKLKLAKGHPISTTKITELTSLIATSKEIADLTGLEGATALTTLDLGQNNEISDLGPLQNLTALTSLDLADNKIVNLSLLSSLTALTTLNLSGNQITSVSNLPSLTSLERLDLRNNKVGDVTSLSTMTHLKYLYLRNNATLTNIKFLVKLKDAGTRIDITLPRAVNIPDSNLLAALLTQLTDPIVPEDMAGLTSLTASNRSISDLTGLETATSLTNLTLSNNNIDDLEPLEELTSLTDLNLSDNLIVDVSPLEELTSLERLDLSNNQIRDVMPLAGLTNLTLLRLNGNTGITNPGALYNLDQQTTTTITGVTVPSAVTFTDAMLEEAVRKALRIADADPILPDAIATLTRLTASRKTITSLSGLETAGILERLDVGQNSISDLGPLSGLMRLEWLDVAENQITDVSPLGSVTSLEALDLRKNKITDVTPLAALTNLRQIYIRGNDGITNLEWLATIDRLRSDIRLPSVVSIPDTNLDTAVRQALRTAGQTVDATLPMSEELLESLETLTASNRNIADLTGCEHMTDLTSLDLRNNQITDVTPLSKLYSLETLMLDGNTILDTSPLYGLLSRNLNNVDITIYRYPSWDVNQDGDVDKADLYLITLIITGTQQDINGDGTFDADDETAADVNRDGTRNINDLRFVFDYLDRPVNLGAPLLNAETGLLELSMLEQMNEDGLRVQLEILRATNDGSLNYQQTLTFLRSLLAAIQPNQTLLLANYPNPFNPETWIPYQLARDSRVRITIYDVQGAIVRELELGYQVEGFYTSRDRAVHWDGRNAVGERVASGIYFYQLETDTVSLLRKMVILK